MFRRRLGQDSRKGQHIFLNLECSLQNFKGNKYDWYTVQNFDKQEPNKIEHLQLEKKLAHCRNQRKEIQKMWCPWSWYCKLRDE